MRGAPWIKFFPGSCVRAIRAGPDARLVRVAGRDLDLRPKAFHLLSHLAENAGRLVSKQELHDAVWGNVAVSDDALVQCIRELRLKLGDVDRTVIRTVPRRGYLLDVGRELASKDLASKDVPDVVSAATVPLDAPATPVSPRRWYAGALVRWVDGSQSLRWRWRRFRPPDQCPRHRAISSRRRTRANWLSLRPKRNCRFRRFTSPRSPRTFPMRSAALSAYGSRAARAHSSGFRV